jgi:hypothetical protein
MIAAKANPNQPYFEDEPYPASEWPEHEGKANWL